MGYVKKIGNHQFSQITGSLFRFKMFGESIAEYRYLTRIDNTTAISYINRMGGVQIIRLNRIIQEIWQWYEARNIVLFASYISSKVKFTADAESRRVEPEIE